MKQIKTYLSRHVAVLRIIFGCMWAIDAALKWMPAFQENFLDYIKMAAGGQPGWLHGWFDFWTQFLSANPHLFAVGVAVIESLIALALIFGLARQVVYLAAAVFSLLVWAIPGGFGGPYSATSTDIGVGIVYAVVFFALCGLERLAGQSSWSLDNLIARQLPWWAAIANPLPPKRLH